MAVDLRRYIVGGYFLSVPRPEPDPHAQMPRLVTLGADHSPRRFFPFASLMTWTSSDDAEVAAGAAPFRLDSALLQQARRWADEEFGQTFGAWHAIYSLAAARRMAATFLRQAEELELWGVGLPISLVGRFLKQSTPAPSPPGYAPIGTGAVHDMVARRRPVAGGGTPLGHEILCYEMVDFQSVESRHGDPSDVLARTRVQPNDLGLIDTLAAARRVAVATDPTLGLRGGWQRTDWMPWLVVRYRLG